MRGRKEQGWVREVQKSQEEETASTSGTSMVVGPVEASTQTELTSDVIENMKESTKIFALRIFKV